MLEQIAKEFGSHLLIPVAVVEDSPLSTTNAKSDKEQQDANGDDSPPLFMLDRKALGSIVFADAQAMSVG